MLPRATPSSRDVDPDGVAAFLDAVAKDRLELHSFMLFRAGAVVAEGFWYPYAADIPHMQHSATKSWTATAVGLAVDDGLLSLEDPVIQFFPEHLPNPVSDTLAAMTVRDLLTMRTGHRTGLSGGAWRGLHESWARAFLAEPVPDQPGHAFIYSSGSSYMLSAIVTEVTGRKVHDLLEERLCRPLGMASLLWDISPEGFSTGGNGQSCRTEDLLKFGVLHLQGGLWNGKRILSAQWVHEATRSQVAEAWLAEMDGRRYLPREAKAEKREGYGYQWWMTRDGGYRAAGLFGQSCIVLPHHDAVIAFTAGLRLRDPRLLDHTWRYLLPALGAGGDASSDPALASRLTTLSLTWPTGATHAAIEPAISGIWTIEPNADAVAEIALAFGETCTFVLRDDRGIHSIVAGRGRLIDGQTSMTGHRLHHHYQPDTMRVLARFVWRDDSTLCLTWRFIETAFEDTVLCRFAAGTVRITRSVNTNAGPRERPMLIGRKPGAPPGHGM